MQSESHDFGRLKLCSTMSSAPSHRRLIDCLSVMLALYGVAHHQLDSADLTPPQKRSHADACCVGVEKKRCLSALNSHAMTIEWRVDSPMTLSPRPWVQCPPIWRWQRPNELLQRSPLPMDVDQINQSPTIFDRSDVLGRESVVFAYIDTPGPKGFDPAGP